MVRTARDGLPRCSIFVMILHHMRTDFRQIRLEKSASAFCREITFTCFEGVSERSLPRNNRGFYCAKKCADLHHNTPSLYVDV